MKKFLTSGVIFFLLLFVVGFVYAETDQDEYVIGAEDELEITFWQEPQLNSTVRVSQDGRIVIPVVGSLTATGLTPSQLGRKIVDKISIFNSSITQASVVIRQYGSNKIYLTGQVRNPGKRTFEVIPNLWDVLLEAGGPTDQAALNGVTIIRGGFEKGKKIVIDLPKYMNDGDLSKLPPLYKGDTIFVPALPNSTPNVRQSSPLTQQNTVYIYGAVNNPGNYMISENTTLLEALALAGGISPAANLKSVRIISRLETSSTVTLINLEDNNSIVMSRPIQIKPNDTIIIPSDQINGFWQQMMLSIITTAISAGVSILLLQVIR
jgi:polysaccharide export outer membrane protein